MRAAQLRKCQQKLSPQQATCNAIRKWTRTHYQMQTPTLRVLEVFQTKLENPCAVATLRLSKVECSTLVM